MASDHPSSTWHVPVPQNVSKSPSIPEEIERVHPDAPEDYNLPRVKAKLTEDTPPRSESSTNKPRALEVSAVPKPNNLFEILIQRVESVNNSSTENSSCMTENLKDQQTRTTNAKATILAEPKANGNACFNGDASLDFHEAGDNDSSLPLKSHRSLFDHLRKNFRMPDDSHRTTDEATSTKSEPSPTIPSDKDVTSSCATKTKEGTQGTDLLEKKLSSSTASVEMNSTINEDGSISTSECYSSSDSHNELNQNDDEDFPFTKRLKWISQRSREGSPSLPQQQQIQTEIEKAVLDSNNLNSSSYEVETSRKTDGTLTDSTRGSVVTSHNSNQIGFQPLVNTNQSGSPNSGSISLRLHNGKAEKTQVSSSSVVRPSLETVRIPANEVYFVLDSNPSRVIELSRNVSSTNVHLKSPSENNGNFLKETGQFYVVPENRQPVCSVLRNPSLSGGSSFVSGVTRNTENNFIDLNEPNVEIVNNEKILHVNPPPVRQNSVDLSSTVYSKSPVHSKAFSPMWDRRSVATSSIPLNHRVPASVPVCYDNRGFTTVSAFGSPVYHPRSHGNPVVYGSQNQLFQPVQLQARQEINFTPRFYQNPRVTTVPNVGQNLRLSCNEYVHKSPPPYTVSERVFRPVSPQWPQVLYTKNVCSSANSFAQVTKNEPTISDEDRDEFSYACALHESANSPDIERMLGSESPDENIYTENVSSTNENPLKQSKFLISKPSVENTSQEWSSISGTVRRAKRLSESPRSTNSGTTRTVTSVIDSCPKADSLPDPRPLEEVVKEIKQEPLDCLREDESDLSQNNVKENETVSFNEQQKKRKINLNVIHKRLEPKLPSPERETSSGDLYRDPSKLTREERALQRAMMQFSEMEMKEKVVQTISKRKRLKGNHIKKTKKTATEPVERKSKLATSTWMLKVKRKQRNWITNRSKLTKKSSDSVRKPNEETTHVVKVEPQLSPDCKETECNKELIKTKIKRRKKKVSPDDQSHENTSVKHRKFTKERKRNPSKEVFKGTPVDSNDAGNQNLDSSKDDQPKKKKKKVQKFREKKRENREYDVTMAKETGSDHVVDTATVTSEASDMVEPRTTKRKRSTESSADRSHRVKTYMLVPSYQGFKDFQPVVMTSRTRNKRMAPAADETTDKSSDKPKVPLLVVESVRSKPVKEMVVAESEEVQRLVTECLRVHGKWHGDELEQALKREEAKLNDAESRTRDAKRLSVNRTTGETILHKAARLGYDEVVKQCILRGADPNARDNAGWTPLHEACARGKLAVVRVLARYGANVNAPSNDGIRPIHDAAEAGHVNVIRVLLSYGADPMLATYAGNNALACAKDPKTKKFLREYCGDITFEDPGNLEENTDGWEFTCTSRLIDNCEHPDKVSGIWEDIPDCSESFDPEFEVSDRPHLNTYNLPVLKDGEVMGRRNYLLVQDIYESGIVARSTLQKRLKNIETREIPWSEFLDIISENHLCVKPSYSPEGSSKEEPKAELIPLNYTIRKLLGIRIEICRR